ncbi:hypothetical protein [Winogradskyella sp. 3972H.M.0a.05]|uniref:hypothetical protein n=1 Tax=Winogradskyella sp. 3972H.M.0a.05 TaxID=2950277 RepID=UPI0033940328
MKQAFTLLTLFALLCTTQNGLSQTEKQVIITGTQTIVSNKVGDKIEALLHFYAERIDEKRVQDFTVYCTANEMRMDAKESVYEVKFESVKSPNDAKENLKEENEISVVFSFDDYGSKLNMGIYLISEDDDGKKTRNLLISEEVPKSDKFTVSKRLKDLLQSESYNAGSWQGHSVIGYAYEGETEIKDSILVSSNKGNNKDDSKVKIKRIDKSYIKLAQNVEGTEALYEFYQKVLENGYDFGGSETGSIMAHMGYFLDVGMPVEIWEIITYTLEQEKKAGVDIIQDYYAKTKINSVKTNDIKVKQTRSSESYSAKQTKGREGAKEPDKPKGCDCSCERYKELMALSKKKKKDIDPNNMPEINMKCMQKCATAWANCRN